MVGWQAHTSTFDISKLGARKVKECSNRYKVHNASKQRGDYVIGGGTTNRKPHS